MSPNTETQPVLVLAEPPSRVLHQFLFYWRPMVLEASTAFCSDEGWKPGTRN